MRPHSFRVEPNPNYDQNPTDEGQHQYIVDFLLDGLSIWRKVRDHPNTYNAEKARCDVVVRRICSLLKKITTKPTHQLRERVNINFGSILIAMVDQLQPFSSETKAYALGLIRDNLRDYLD